VTFVKMAELPMIVQERRYSSGLLTLIASVNNHYAILEKIGGILMLLALSGIPKVMASQDSTTECHYFSFTIQKVVSYRVA
jgi:hypothetical protein